MIAISAAAINRQTASITEKPWEEVELELEADAHEREEAIKLVDFHVDGQYMGNDGKVYRMTAEYADDATNVFPKVKVTVTDENGNAREYHVDITKVDTGNATEIEMFALCSHADTKRGRYADIAGDTLSSWESLLFYREVAEQKEGTAQSKTAMAFGTEAYNWRDMVGSVAETHIEEGAYERYLHVNRMKDMLDYYSHFDGRPDAFEDKFHAIRDYEFIQILSLDNGLNIEIYDKQKKIVCKDMKGAGVLWGGELTDEEFEKAKEIISKQYTDYGYGGPYQAFLGSYNFWEGILSGEMRLEDCSQYVQELKRQYLGDMFDTCPQQVKEAWKRTEEELDFQGLGLKKDTMEVEFLSEYMRLMAERMQKGMGMNVLGTSVESAIEMARQCIKNLDEMDFSRMSASEKRLKLKERVFYYNFIECLDPTQKYEPARLLLQA